MRQCGSVRHRSIYPFLSFFVAVLVFLYIPSLIAAAQSVDYGNFSEVTAVSLDDPSERFISFEVNKALVSYDGVFSVSFDGDLTGNYLVRPMLMNGNIEIYNPSTSEWAASSSTWDTMPMIDDEMFLRISSMGNKKNILSFELLDANNGRILETMGKPVFGRKVYEGYVESVNESVINAEQSIDVAEVSPQVLKENSPAVRIPEPVISQQTFSWSYLYIISVIVVSVSLVVSYLSLRRLSKMVLK